MGNEAGLRTPDGLNIFSLAIPVASQIPQSVGAAMAAQRLKRKNAVVCTFGDGATSEGDFHEGLNFAGVFHTPNVFVCYNNQWAISTPRSRQTASETIAQKASAYGFPGVQVDGNDILAVYAAVSQALARPQDQVQIRFLRDAGAHSAPGHPPGDGQEDARIGLHGGARHAHRRSRRRPSACPSTTV